jgi:hypothetical protein
MTSSQDVTANRPCRKSHFVDSGGAKLLDQKPRSGISGARCSQLSGL